LSRLGSPQAGSRRVAIAKPKNDVFVALLGIALGAVIVACILLAMEMSKYEWSVTPKASLDHPSISPVRLAGTFDRMPTSENYGGAVAMVLAAG